jgi:hypothetical protein
MALFLFFALQRHANGHAYGGSLGVETFIDTICNNPAAPYGNG